MNWLTKQEIFDKAACGMLLQAERSYAPGSCDCGYRGANGLKCPIGFLIADEHYNECFNELSFPDTSNAAVAGNDKKLVTAVRKSGVMINESNVELMRRLQSIHDICDEHTWYSELSDTADEFSLNKQAIKKAAEKAAFNYVME